MTTIAFDPAAFRALFPAFSDVTTYPDVVLQLYWDTGTAYISDEEAIVYCGSMSVPQQTLALNYMAAHLAALNALIAAGETPGIETSSSIDKISVTMQPPPAKTQWQWWLNTTPYGSQLLALLSALSVGGFYFSGGGFSPKLAFRN
jgi:Protein of unknown function (DUF4054)